jgi:hypothetical protein
MKWHLRCRQVSLSSIFHTSNHIHVYFLSDFYEFLWSACVTCNTHKTVMLCLLPRQRSFILKMYLDPVFCEWVTHKHGNIYHAIYLQTLDNNHSNKLLERIQVFWDVTLCWLRVKRAFEMC